MSRYRPPSLERASIYITTQGHARLKNEYDHLWRVRRPEVVRALATAAAEGDRSENAEYQYRKKELREIDRRVHYLQVRLPDLQVVDRPPDRMEKIFFGAIVEVATDAGKSRHYRIVGADEAGDEPGYISVDSPLARALLGKQPGEVVRVRLPGGEAEWEVIGVQYRPPSDSHS